MLLIQFGIIFCALSVIIGAFGAHSLESTIADKMDTFKTGVQYQIFHGLALILTGILSKVLEVNLNISDKHQVVASLEKVLKQLKNKG